jgi:hypothetical protein
LVFGVGLPGIEALAFLSRPSRDRCNGSAHVLSRGGPEKQILVLQPLRELIDEREALYDDATRQNGAGRQYCVGADPASIANQ